MTAEAKSRYTTPTVSEDDVTTNTTEEEKTIADVTTTEYPRRT